MWDKRKRTWGHGAQDKASRRRRHGTSAHLHGTRCERQQGKTRTTKRTCSKFHAMSKQHIRGLVHPQLFAAFQRERASERACLQMRVEKLETRA